VRLVVHYQMPANIDSLYQEMGRAGRDGKDSTCILLYARKDKGLQGFFIQQSDAPFAIKKTRWSTFDALVDYCEGGECRHAEILTYYRDSQRITACGHCDVCAPDSARKIQKPVITTVVEDAADFVASVVKAKKKKSVSKKSADDAPLTGLEDVRFQDLRAWRKQKAQELDVPAFIVCSDKTLKQLAVVNPTSIEALHSIYGLGESKIAQFGKDIVVALGH
jgi:ATP-dependent DNA helicase RecQ